MEIDYHVDSTKKCTHTFSLFLERLECNQEVHEMECEGRRGALSSSQEWQGMAITERHGEAIIDTAIIEIDAEIGTSASEA